MDVPEEVRTFYESIRLQMAFLDDVASLECPEIGEVADTFCDYLSSDITHRTVHILSKGRSNLSAQSFLQGLYNVTFKLSERHRFYPATLRDGVLKYISGSSLILAASGSGETKEVNRYLRTAIDYGAKIVLITGKEGSTAYNLVKDAGGCVVILKSHSKEDREVDEAIQELSPLGSEFELKLWLFLNALVPEIRGRLEGKSGTACPEFRRRLEVFEENLRPLLEDWVDHQYLSNWIKRLTNRHGLFVFYGVSRSGHVAEQFEMRFAHANKSVFMYDDSNRKPFRAGDACVVLSGSGNTLDVLDVTMDALGLTEEDGEIKRVRADRAGVDVFAITMNRSSRLTRLLEFVGQEENILYLPIKKAYEKAFIDSTSNSIISPTDIDKFRIPIFETSAYMVTNAIVAQVGEDEGIIPHKFFRREHV
ncbi:MAG: SIS domain-containing protein [Euryarchaeota archaeon]|nr:SIS domain-containing protein [Euryarchaeota archaeon]